MNALLGAGLAREAAGHLAAAYATGARVLLDGRCRPGEDGA